ncbi:MAG: DDE-type integrase/transposase/recombinase [Salibacteraceae bacterium]
MPDISKNRYDSFLVWLYCNDKAHLIPNHIKQLIPNSTASTWRNVDYNNFIGNELRTIQNEALDHYTLLQEHRNLKRVVTVITKVWLGVSSVLMPIIHKQKEMEALIVDEVQRLFVVMPKRTALRLWRLSPSMFYERISRLKAQCGISPLDRCFKRHPLQLSMDEVRKIKMLYEDASKSCWPSSSLYYHGLRNCELYVSLSTFYKYVNLLGLKRKFPKAIQKTEGLRAFQPNQYLHVDTTKWELESGIKACIVFVTDNFSRAILGWSVSLNNNAQNVIAALQQTIATINQCHPKHACTVLVADGGGENHGITISELLRQCPQPQINKVIAQKDIVFSNSPVEAVNRTVKKYLRHHKPRSELELKRVIQFIVQDYNHIRPHISLNGLMPIEAYTDSQKVLDFSREKRNAKALRLAQNQKNGCETCR